MEWQRVARGGPKIITTTQITTTAQTTVITDRRVVTTVVTSSETRATCPGWRSRSGSRWRVTRIRIIVIRISSNRKMRNRFNQIEVLLKRSLFCSVLILYAVFCQLRLFE